MPMPTGLRCQLRAPRPARIALLAVLVCLLQACASFVPQPGPAPDAPGEADGYVALTLPVTVLGDTQEHESTGYPLHDNDSAVDAFVEVAQRPPEQPLFGRRVLQWALNSHPEAPFIHLGDVMDLSCRSEAERMQHILQASAQPGAVLPGNHDGLMFGIYNYRILDAVLDADAQRWRRACRRGASPEDTRHKSADEALSKRDFIHMVLAQQAARPGVAPGLQLPPLRGEVLVSWRHPDPKAFFSGVEARLLDGLRYADSYLAQRLVLPAAPGAPRRVVVVGLDTNQSGALVTAWDMLLGRSPGSQGHVHFNQVAAVSKWVLEAARNDDIVVFAGHHNWTSLGLPSRVLLRNLMSSLRQPLVYLSAHTHRGFWAVHTALDRRPLLELNVSSLSDWPVAWRQVSFAWNERAQRLQVRGLLMPAGATPHASDADLLAAWEAAACSASGVATSTLQAADQALVQRQREARGNVLQWALGALGAACDGCDAPLYDHAHSYLDEMLEAIVQLGTHLGTHAGAAAHQLHAVPLPAWCAGADFGACARGLQVSQAEGFAANVALFRRKAVLVNLLSGHLDRLDSAPAAAYMTCRAVQAAKLDFDATDDVRNSGRSEANRRAEQYFRVQASVGLD